MRAEVGGDGFAEVTFLARAGGGGWKPIGTDTSSPVYTAFDDTTGLADGSVVRYRAVLTYAPTRRWRALPAA
ncbi:MAG TPA: hypothetical protein VK942_06575 [Actinomycetes bacterium]|nr:hypothetical protein [Actinomycetes bacterium]